MRAHPKLPSILIDSDPDDFHVLEAVEAARILPAYEGTSEFFGLLNYFLNSEQPYVRIESYHAIRAMKHQPGQDVHNMLMDVLVSGDSHFFEWVQAARAYGKWWPRSFREILVEVPHALVQNGHFANDFIILLQEVYSPGETVGWLEKLIEIDDVGIGVAVIGQAGVLASNNSSDDQLQSRLKSVFIRAARFDRHQISQYFWAASRTLDWVTDLDDDQVRAHLARGRQIDEVDPPKIHVPNPEIIKELGPHPMWILNTDSGDIQMRLNTLKAPSTVSLFYSLIRNGWYVGSPFHRVVNNFVIQGGSIWHDDYDLDPVFRLPTEANESDFSRGAVGIASAGRDTETSQFFMMHMWAPHLNGGYSNIGRVVDGIEVVDSMLQGTIITGSSINPCY